MRTRKKKNKIVLAFGTFDILHPGHLFYLSQSKKQGDILVVVIARDSTVKRLKGRNPIFRETERLEMVAALKMVDRAVLGDPLHHCRIIEKIRPDILCLGYDQNITTQKLSEQLKRMKIPFQSIKRIGSYRKESQKSSHYKHKILTQKRCVSKKDLAPIIA